MNWTLTDTQQRASGCKNETAGVKELSVLTTGSRLQKSRLLSNAYIAKLRTWSSTTDPVVHMPSFRVGVC